MVHIKINGKPIEVKEGSTILAAAKENNIQIPTLCHLQGQHEIGACRICVVEVDGAKALQASCITPVSEGMVIHTHSQRVLKRRKVLYELMLSDHPKDCLNCLRNQHCELQALGEIIQADEARFAGAKSKPAVADEGPSIVREPAKCILCRRCVTTCNEVQGVGVLNAQNRGFSTEIGPGNGLPLYEAACTTCGQCTVVCPVNALHERESGQDVWAALADPKKTVIVQTAPAIRAALGEEFGYSAGTLVTGKMVSALKELGFRYIFDTNFAADLTILEEGHELLNRLANLFYQSGKVDAKTLEKLGVYVSDQAPALPMITSCSPGWIKYIEHYFSGELDHLSTCKSPHMMLGALIKSYFADKIGVKPQDMYVVSIMPCTAKKFEITRPEMAVDGVPNVDAVLTTRELARMIRQAGINFTQLPEGEFDHPLGLSTGAADIFGTTGGVMEAALRTVYEVVTGRELPFKNLHVTPIVGLERIKTASITLQDVLPDWSFLEGVEVKVAVTSGLSGAGTLMREVRDGTSPYHFMEVMACPGGCITGGGQPRSDDPEVRTKRMGALYREDEGKPVRKSHENPDLLALYQEYLEHPLGHLSHMLLHTGYTVRSRY